MVFAVYKRNNGNTPDTFLSYANTKEAAEDIIPPINKDKYYIQELECIPKTETEKQIAKLWTRDDAADFQKKSVVSNPMFHRTDKETTYPAAINYYIDYYNKCGADNVSCVIYNVDEDLNSIQTTLKCVKRDVKQQQEDYYNKYKERYKGRYTYSRPKIAEYKVKDSSEDIINLAEIKVPTKKPASHYTQYIKKTEDIKLDGSHIFYFQYRYCCPDMTPTKSHLYDSSVKEESTEASFKPGWYRKDRDFYLTCYAKSQEKAEKLIKEKLKLLIKDGTLKK